MIITDIIALAKAGYSVADVKELMTLPNEPQPKPTEGTIETPIENASKEDTQPVETPIDNTGKAEESVIDYKKLYEETQEQLKTAQATNLQMNIKTEEQGDNELYDLVKSFM